ncbi:MULTISPECIES: hypothetical protein [unclassified Streptomyces]|uniref:hypothetical protein n=1 Tax=unclassified Streptomyces TaxID=2593676 RepID=UPI0029B8AFC7|nr:hypothetical protein [Streptomyces sp. PA03-2a]MDX2732929.1 hypothetical protein [Streptomyces sp. PA03-2a]
MSAESARTIALAPFGKGPSEKDPGHGHLVGGLLHSADGSGTAPGTRSTRLQSLADAKGAVTWDLSVDSTVCRAHIKMRHVAELIV